jgi:hypothetical protein
MLSQDDSQPLYITGGRKKCVTLPNEYSCLVGGQGGLGGQGLLHGTGGRGGDGLGPTVHITAHQLIAPNLHAMLALEQALQPSNIQASQIVIQCPPPSRIFEGRKDILARMHHFFTSKMGRQLIYVLHGLGGAGKTQIALKFINESTSQ